MAKLEKLEEEIYEKEEGEELAKRTKGRVFFPKTPQRFPTAWSPEKPRPVEIKTGESKLKDIFYNRLFFRLVMVGFVIIAIIGVGLFIFFFLGTRGGEVQITIHDIGPIISGELITIPISFKNVYPSTLREVQLIMVFPEGSVFQENGIEHPAPSRIIIKLDDLSSGEEITREIKARVFGSEGELRPVEVKLLYRPENLQARFSSSLTKSFVVSSVPLALFWETPESFTPGQDVTFKVRYSSNASFPFENLSLRLEYPPGFTFSSSEPAPTLGQNIWSVGNIQPGQEGSIIINGAINGIGGETKTFQGGIGVFNTLTKDWKAYRESSKVVTMAIDPLSARGFLGGAREGIIYPAESLNFSIQYQNNTGFSIKDVTVSAYLEGNILDLAKLRIDQNGVFDATKHAVVWGPGNTPALGEVGPGEKGELSFALPAREQPIVRSGQDKNLVVRLRTTIDTLKIPQELRGTRISSPDSLEFGVVSKVIFSSKSVYRVSPILNTGPLPPKAGQKTAYTIIFEVKNFTNDLRSTQITAKIPPNVMWENKISPQGAAITFDPSSNQVTWNIGELKAGVGVLVPTFVGAFQVSVIPSEADIGKSITLVNEPHLTALDSFVNTAIEDKTNSITTELFGESNTFTDWRVQP